MATLDVRSLAQDLPGGAGLSEVSFTVGDGRICAVLGAAGSGKTALLRAIAGLEAPTAGEVRVSDATVLDRPAHRRGIGLMFQDLALFPHLTVRENIAFGLRMVGWAAADRDQRVDDLLEVVGLTGLGGRMVDALGASEQQRVALARTLAPHPTVLLLDEPLGEVDELTKVALRQELRAILAALEVTTVVATRDLRDAIGIADDLVVLEDGRVLQSGPIGVVLGEPASVRVAEIAGYITLAHGAVRRGRVEEPGVGAMAVPGLPDAPAARVMAHPASLLAVPADSGLGSGVAGLVVRSRAVGPTWVVDLTVGGRLVEARWEWDLVAPRAGTRLAIAARPGTLRVFPSTLAEAAGAPAAAAPAAPATPSTPRPVEAPARAASDAAPAAAVPSAAVPSAAVPPASAVPPIPRPAFSRPVPPVAPEAPAASQEAVEGAPARAETPVPLPQPPRPVPTPSPPAPNPSPVPPPQPPAPAPVPPREPGPAPVPPPASPRPTPSQATSGPAAPGLPASAVPPRRGATRTALPPTIRSEQRHRQMPLS